MDQFTGYVTVFEQKFATPPDPSTLAVIGGYATKYWSRHVYKGGIDVFTDRSFHETIIFGKPVSFLINHDWGKVVGGTKDGLELLSDSEGLAFRYPLPDTALGREALSMITAGKGQAGMSVGYKVVDKAFITIDGQQVQVLRKCELTEISIVKVGAVPGAFAGISSEPGDQLKLACDAAAINVRWAMHDFTKAIEKITG